ncbi:hypothetical protein [Nostoc sp.]|uniref:hypothetical protein n=1 Tax=Nostoc sp. TaxID=1180 RepID=UPI002FF759F0
MAYQHKLTPQDIAIRAHDITVCLERSSVSSFDELVNLGMAVRLAIHLRGVPAVPYELLRDVAVHLLNFSTGAVRPVVELLAEAEFVRLDTQGRTIKTVIPDIPFYQDLFSTLGKLLSDKKFSEPEQLTLSLVHQLAGSPILADHAYNLGAEKNLVDKIINIGTNASFIVKKRARGKSVLISPTYFPENTQAYADLVSTGGSQRVKKILDLLRSNQGWPLKLLLKKQEIAGVSLDNDDLTVIQMFAKEGFIPPPAIETTHSGTNHFIFGPRPGLTQLPPYKRPIYEAAMSLVAAVRQGQLLPSRYAIHSPLALLRSFKNKGFIKANTEALEQYKKVAASRVGRLEITTDGWAKLVLIDSVENIEAVNMALELVSGSETSVVPDENIIIALRTGEHYVESLIGRKSILQDTVIPLDEESQALIDNFLLRAS